MRGPPGWFGLGTPHLNVGRGTIRLYDVYFEQGKVGSFIHEIGHAIDSAAGYAHSDYVRENDVPALTGYGETSPQENLGEALRLWIYPRYRETGDHAWGPDHNALITTIFHP